MKANQLVWALLLAGVAVVKLPAQTLQTLCSFNFTNGEYPQAALTLGNDGNFYGTTVEGGITNSANPSGMGTVFQVATNGTLTTLIAFKGTNGANPNAALTLGNDGNFYGTTQGGGNVNLNSGYGFGTVFKMTTNGALTTLVSFSGTNGAYPNSMMTLGNDGSFYGTTYYGGITNSVGAGDGWGTVFKVTTNGTLTALVFFDNTNGAWPLAPLTLGIDGNFYGTTGSGGNINLRGGYGCGTVFEVTTDGMLTTLASFANTNGAYPNALTLGTDGNFYGTTEDGGSSGSGTVFQVTTNGTLTTLVFFNNTNGAYPDAKLTLGSDCNFYGTAPNGGITNSANPFGMGTVFRVTTNGTLTTLGFFDYTNGANPIATVTLGNDGNFYGTTANGGSSGWGTVFRLSLLPVVPPTLTLQIWEGYPLLSLYGTLGDTYRVEYATNLTVPNWIPMLIVPNLSISPFQMIDPAGVGQPMRFYRAVQSQ